MELTREEKYQINIALRDRENYLRGEIARVKLASTKVFLQQVLGEVQQLLRRLEGGVR